MDASSFPQANTCLRQARVARNWRQRDLAEQLGTTVASVKRWERGSHQPSAYYRVKLCALFGKSAEELGFVKANLLPQPAVEREFPTREKTSFSSKDVLAVWTVPYSRNPHFIGRNDLLDQLTERLSSGEGCDHQSIGRALLTQPQALTRYRRSCCLATGPEIPEAGPGV